MKILELRIEDFGGLHDLTLPLENGLNLILKENGWGKSTLMAFIRIMFFGFDGEQKRNIEENERKRYRPWQGGVYGGSILFQTGRGLYRLERTFGERREDSFALYDGKSGLPSEDYSDRIGEELFQIDRESFSKSIFTGQLEAETEATAGIHAKIADLAAEEADMSQYERAQKILKKQSDFLTPKRKTGRLSKLKDEIQGLEYEIRLLSEEKKSLEDLEKQKRELEKEKKELTAKRTLLQKEILSRGRALAAEAEERRQREKTFPKEAGDGERETEEREPFGRGLLAGFFLGILLLLAGFFFRIRLLELGGALLLLLSAGLLLKKTGEAFSENAETDRKRKKSAEEEEKRKAKEKEEENRKDRSLQGEENLEKLVRSLETINSRLDWLGKEKEEKRLLAEEAEAKLEKLLQKQERLEAKREEEKSLQRKYDILELTRQSLEKAKVSFSTRYLDRVKEAFDHYYRVIAGKEERSFFLDANLALCCREQGQLRESRLMSRGYRDLIGICRRMAFLDAMYEKEKPPLFFDDPFAGLDEEKIEGGMSLLEEIADRYQVIYLTCHKDRI